jgi:hypothetical protein
MGSPALVVFDIGPERPIEMPSTEDERPVEALGPHRLDHPLGMGIRVGSLDRRADDPHPLRANDLVEPSVELRVPVPDEEPDGARPSVEVQGEVPGLLGNPRRVRVRRYGTQVDPPAAELDGYQDVERPEPGGLDGEEVAGDDRVGLGPEHEVIADYQTLRDAVRDLGRDLRVAVDDAGAGVANFGHIIELRPDLVKLDISIVRGVNTDVGRQALVVGMRHFSRTAGCRLIAEGVETEEEARTLTALSVEFGQGYWFGRPDRAEAWASAKSGD